MTAAESLKAALDAQVTRLPKWAQEKIRHLEYRLQAAADDLAAIRERRPESPVQVRPGGSEPSYGLPEWASVTVQLGTARYADGRPRHMIEVRLRDGKVELMGSTELTVYARSSNVVHVDIADRYELNEAAPIRDLGERLIKELVAKGLGWQDGLNLIAQADPVKTKGLRLFKDKIADGVSGGD